MKPISRVPSVNAPGALSGETLGSHAAAPTESSSSQPQAMAELVVEFDTDLDPPRTDSGSVPAKKAGPARSAAGKHRVLVADDSPAVRDLLARALSNEGYEVVLAANGQEALERFVPGLIDLVLLDLEMPVKSGWETFEEVIALDHDQAIILMADRLDAVDLTTTGHVTRLAEKPINLNALLAAVRRALSESAALHRSAITSQQNLLRYTRPFVSKTMPASSYNHWGIND